MGSSTPALGAEVTGNILYQGARPPPTIFPFFAARRQIAPSGADLWLSDLTESSRTATAAPSVIRHEETDA
jgi:hypothetical protein